MPGCTVIQYNNGTTEWLTRGLLHRTDGPAVERKGWVCEYWVYGQRLTEDEFYLYVDQLTGDVLVPPGKELTFSPFVNKLR